jgi:hypothetical protein
MNQTSRQWWGTAAVWALAPIVGFSLPSTFMVVLFLFGDPPLLGLIGLQLRWGWVLLLVVWFIAVWLVLFQHRVLRHRVLHFAGANLLGAAGLGVALAAF